MSVITELFHEHLRLQREVGEVMQWATDETYASREWRYSRLLWQDKLHLEVLRQLTRVADAVETRNKISRDFLLEECSSATDRNGTPTQ